MRYLLLAALCVAVTAADVNAQDPGVLDTVKLLGDTLVVGQSLPLKLSVVNDETLVLLNLGFIVRSLDVGFAIFDSAVCVNRMADPSVMDARFVRTAEVDGTPPDTILFGALCFFGNPLPVGGDVIAELYFTGLSVGDMRVDSSFVVPVNEFFLETDEGSIVIKSPAFVTNNIHVVEGSSPPVISLSDHLLRLSSGEVATFEINAYSPKGLSVTLDIEELTGYDTPRTPINNPVLSGSAPATFTWETTPDDVSIWKAVIRACDTDGLCATSSAQIQLVQNENYLLCFDVSAEDNPVASASVALGNFDGDAHMELICSGIGVDDFSGLALYDYDIDEGKFLQAYGTGTPWGLWGLQPAYIDADDHLDLVASREDVGADDWIIVMKGGGDNSLSLFTESLASYMFRGAALCELTRDRFLDYIVAAEDKLVIYTSDGDSEFQLLHSLTVADTALTVNSADFNQDGFDDLAVGTAKGIQIFLNDGAGGLLEGEFYSQSYGTVDMEVTNRGSDFNNDNIYDLCVSTPSVGLTYSEVMAYLGMPDGTFEQRPVRTVRGHVFGNCVADFNNDNELDIAYVNGSESSVGILFGDGEGAFANEIRFDIGDEYAANITCSDFDLDGDVDIAVATKRGFPFIDENWVYLLLNRLDPEGFEPLSLEAAGMDNVDLQITSSSGKTISKIKSSMPAAAYYRRNVDGNATLDDFLTLGVVEHGIYHIDAAPRPDLPEGELFSLQYVIGDHAYRLAHEVPMTTTGYRFAVYPSGDSPVTPVPGEFTADNPIAFQWTGDGSFVFQLAVDIEFTELLASTTVSGNSYLGPVLALSSDTVTYYWRVRPVGNGDFDAFYPINIILESPTIVEEESETLPVKCSLSQNYPNPFNPNTQIMFTLPQARHVTLEIYNIVGQRVRKLACGHYAAGIHTVTWDGTDSRGATVAAGVYLYHIDAGDYSASKKMLILK